MAGSKFTPPSGSQHPPLTNGKIGGVHSPGPCANDPGQATSSNPQNAVVRTRPPLTGGSNK